MIQCNRHLRAGSVLLAAVSIVLVSGSASLAADRSAPRAKSKPVSSRATTVRKPATAVSTTALGAAGMRVAIDPQTGLLIKPTPEQRQALGTAGSIEFDRSSEGLVILTLPDGTKLCHLEGRFQEYVVARKDAAGNLRTDCVESRDHARRLQATPVTPRPGLVRQDDATRVKE